MSISRQLSVFLEEIEKTEKNEELPEKMKEEKVTPNTIEDLKRNLETLKSKLGGDLDVDNFVKNLKSFGVKIPKAQTEEVEEMEEDLWSKIKNSKEIPAALTAAISIALIKSGLAAPDDPIEVLHYGELVEQLAHGIAMFGPRALEVAASVLG